MSENGNIKVLNLYAGLGGNRKLWEGVDVTGVENDPEVARVYRDYFPDDTVIIADAHQYLLDHYQEFDFIWSSPPCPTHSIINFSSMGKNGRGGKEYEYPDMRLWQEIIFLQQWCNSNYVVENVIPYYQPLIAGKKIGRHIFWSNFKLGQIEVDYTRGGVIRRDQILELQQMTGFDLSNINISGKRQKLRNCVHPEIGLYIFKCAKGIITKPNEQQLTIFEQ